MDNQDIAPAALRLSRPAARLIRSDDEALDIARALAARFAEGAIERDQLRLLPRDEIDLFSASGLWGITVPRAHGGAQVSFATLAEVIAIVAEADPSLAQIPQNHLALIDALRATADEPQRQRYFAAVLAGLRFGNAFSESGSRTAATFDTTLTPHGGGYLVNGEKFYATGALFADIVPVSATGPDGRVHLAFAARDAKGLVVTDNWSGFGQRTTASGSVSLSDVFVPAEDVVPAWKGSERPSVNGPVSQIIQAAIDLGIGRAALADTIRFVREQARPWVDAGVERASDDPYTIASVGELVIRRHAAEAILERAGRAIDHAIAAGETEADTAAAALAVAEAKVLTTEFALLAANRLHELGGTRSTLARHGLDRHWRNARTHTLHDPVRWKYAVIGNHALNGVPPARHPWL